MIGPKRPHGWFPPPNDGREWMLLDEAAALFKVKPVTLAARARRHDWTRTCWHGAKVWLLKKEVMHWYDFLKMRDGWYKNHRPKHWRPEIAMNAREDEESFQRVYWNTERAAAYMGVSKNTIHKWTRSGRIPVFLTRKMGKGGRNWYSPTSLRNFKEDEDRQKRLRAQEKGKDTMRQGIVARHVYNSQHRPRTYSIPAGWLTVREAAERLDISHGSLRALARRGSIPTRQFVGEWDAKKRPWFFEERSIEEYKNSEHYQKTHRRGKNAALSVLGRSLPNETPSNAPVQDTKTRGDSSDLTCGYTYAQLVPDWGEMPPSSLNLSEW